VELAACTYWIGAAVRPPAVWAASGVEVSMHRRNTQRATEWRFMVWIALPRRSPGVVLIRAFAQTRASSLRADEHASRPFSEPGPFVVLPAGIDIGRSGRYSYV
jgi:hypothetical protein